MLNLQLQYSHTHICIHVALYLFSIFLQWYIVCGHNGPSDCSVAAATGAGVVKNDLADTDSCTNTITGVYKYKYKYKTYKYKYIVQ